MGWNLNVRATVLNLGIIQTIQMKFMNRGVVFRIFTKNVSIPKRIFFYTPYKIIFSLNIQIADQITLNQFSMRLHYTLKQWGGMAFQKYNCISFSIIE